MLYTQGGQKFKPIFTTRYKSESLLLGRTFEMSVCWDKISSMRTQDDSPRGDPRIPEAPPPGHLRTAEVVLALSLASDMAVGLSLEHCARACYIGMQLAQELELPAEGVVELFYAELLKDAGCTAWSSPIAQRFLGDEIAGRRDLFFYTNSRDKKDVLLWLTRHMSPGAPLHTRFLIFIDFVANGQGFVREGLINTAEVAHASRGDLACHLAYRMTWHACSSNGTVWGPKGPEATISQ